MMNRHHNHIALGIGMMMISVWLMAKKQALILVKVLGTLAIVAE